MSSGSGLLLEVKDLKKSFPGVLALKGVSLTLGKGEVISLIGENGAGKSTHQTRPRRTSTRGGHGTSYFLPEEVSQQCSNADGN